MKITILIAVVVSGISFSCNQVKKIEVIGHRGAMGYQTENTLASVEKALQLGVDMIEIDVFRCRTQEIVVFHDQRLERLTNGEGFIEDFSFFQLRSLVVNGDHRIPLLQDILKLVNKQCRVNIELKGANTADKVHHILTYYIEKNGWKPNDFLISSFNEKELRDFYALTQDIPIAVLTEGKPTEAIKIAQELHAVSINANYKQLTSENVKTIQKQGFKVYAWTVNEVEDIQKMIDFKVNGIFSDFPDQITR